MWQLWPGTAAEGLMLFGALAVILGAYRRSAGWPFALTTALAASGAFWVVGNASIPAAVAAGGVVLALGGRQADTGGTAYLRELGIVFAGFGLYTGARYLAEGDPGTAHAHALDILAFERALGLDFEATLQDWLLRPDGAMRAFSAFYSYGFLATVAAMLVYLYVADRRNYRLYRNALGISVVWPRPRSHSTRWPRRGSLLSRG